MESIQNKSKRKIIKDIQKEISRLDDLLTEIDFYDEKKLLEISKHLIKQYGDLLKGNMNLFKKVNNKGVYNG